MTKKPTTIKQTAWFPVYKETSEIFIKFGAIKKKDSSFYMDEYWDDNWRKRYVLKQFKLIEVKRDSKKKA